MRALTDDLDKVTAIFGPLLMSDDEGDHIAYPPWRSDAVSD